MDNITPSADVAITVDAESLPTPIRDALAPNTAARVVPEQASSHVNSSKLSSEKVVVAAPLSYAGSASRLWKLTGVSANPAARIGLALLAILLIIGAWTFVTAWYFTWGIFLVPYRLTRRGQRKRKREALQHRELLEALNRR